MSHFHPADLHGLSKLAVDGVLGTTSLVEEMHYAIGRVSGPSLATRDGRTRGITGLVYRSIHGITGLVGQTADLAFGQIVPRLPQTASTIKRDRILAVLNGVLGDHLEASGNPLSLKMDLRHGGQSLVPDPDLLAAQLPHISPRIAIFLHGLCMSDHHWTPAAECAQQTNLPRAVFENAGYLPLHLNYNTGRHISDNGQDFAVKLEALIQAWPGPVDELVLIGHSMGGLVARSACHQAEVLGHDWVTRTRRLITLGSPHHGAPLERIGHLVDRTLALTPFSRPFTRLGAIRSAGITDLRHGNLLAEDRQPAGRPGTPRDDLAPPTLPSRIQIFALAGTLSDHENTLRSRVIGDGLVTVDSALGRHSHPERNLQPDDHQVLTQTSHLQLVNCPRVAGQVLAWLNDS